MCGHFQLLEITKVDNENLRAFHSLRMEIGDQETSLFSRIAYLSQPYGRCSKNQHLIISLGFAGSLKVKALVTKM